MIFVQLLVNSLIIGSLYALVACGFSMIYSTNRFMHFAHGSSVALASFMLYWFFGLLNVPLALSIVLVLIVAALFGYLVQKAIYEPLQRRKSSNVILLIASVGILILFENLLQITFGSNIKTILIPVLSQNLLFLGIHITVLQLLMFSTSLVLLILLYLFMNKTKIGRRLRAVADNKELGEIIGLDAKKLMSLAMIIGSVLAGVAGIFIGIEQSIEPTMGTALMIKGFTGAIIGGVTSVPASILGSYLLGIAENFGTWYIPAGYKDAISFVLLFLFLLFKPTGIFGIRKGVNR